MKIFLSLLFNLFFNLFFMSKAYAFSCDSGNYCDVKKDKDGLKIGVETCKDSNGVIRRKISYQNNEMNGLWECFDEKAKLIESREYKNDKLNGLTRRYKADLDKYEEVRYADDDLDGENLVYQSATSSGKTSLTGFSKTSYKKGKKDGFMVTFDKEGKELKRICYKDDRLKDDNPELCGGAPKLALASSEPKENPHKGWKTREFKSGKIKAKYLLVAYNDIDEASLFFENEKTKATFKRTSKGELMKSSDVYQYKQFDSKGVLQAEGDCLVAGDDLIDLEYGYCIRLSGTRYDYDPKGNLLSKVSYKNGRYDGDSFYNDKSSDIETRIIYKDDVKLKLIEKKISTNAILKTEEYFEDGSTR